ncbi:hypothetical protein WHR41_01083 [Cladosporium halotolerans]|uniref:Mitochondrial import receptor subunit tom22 n=1 Tax=Cladosporium halotolerans TaxID=1052096 RepID=A0AB34L112_9PEZI
MVKLEEVPDEDFQAQQQGPKIEEEDDWDTDSESDTSEISDDSYEESLADRIAALADIVPPTYRKRISSAANTTYDWTASGLSFSGKALWVISTSALLLGIPWALAFSEEQQMQEMEREMRMQQGASEVLTGGAQAGEQAAKPAL